VRVKTLSKRDAILEGASRVLATKQFHEVTSEEIAAEAGVGKGTLYRYFQTKEEIYFATIVKGFEGLHQVLATTIEQEISPTERLRRIARECLRFFWHRRYFYALLYRNDRLFVEHEGEIRQARERVIGVIQRVVVDGIRQKEFRGVDSRLAAEFFSGMIRAANIFRRDDDTAEALVGELMAIFTGGIARASRP
jgi:AcrR family transcriptional regulator